MLRLLGYPHRRRKMPDHCLSQCTRINSKWSKDLNVTLENIKLSEQGVQRMLRKIAMDKGFLYQTPTHEREKQAVITPAACYLRYPDIVSTYRFAYSSTGINKWIRCCCTVLLLPIVIYGSMPIYAVHS